MLSEMIEYLLQNAETDEMSMLIILKIATAAGFVLALVFVVRNVRKRRCKSISCASVQRTQKNGVGKSYCFSVQQESIISHKDLLTVLEYAANRCYNKLYALKCIDIVAYCPQLVNIKSPISGLTPFHRVCYHGHSCLIEFMLKKGADPFVTTEGGEDALCMAIYHLLNNPLKDDFESIDLLEKAGCRMHPNHKWYNVYLKVALLSNHRKLVQWLILHCKTMPRRTIRCVSTPPKSKHYIFQK